MEKAGVSPLPVYQKLHDAITKDVMKIIKKKRDKYHLRSVEIDDKCVLTYIILIVNYTCTETVRQILTRRFCFALKKS